MKACCMCVYVYVYVVLFKCQFLSPIPTYPELKKKKKIFIKNDNYVNALSVADYFEYATLQCWHWVVSWANLLAADD